AVDPALVQRLDPSETAAVRALVDGGAPDAMVCANDRTAARLMQTLGAIGRAVPADVRLTGIDDSEVANLLPVPLTTLRQPTRAIGDAAISAMLERIARPSLPPRDILLPCELVIRASCGGVGSGSVRARRSPGEVT